MAHSETPVKVLEIIGLGRSGSTILDIALGNHPHIESVGEVMDLIRTGWVSRESLNGIDPKRLRRPICTCGKRLDVLYVDDPNEACPFWSRVRSEWVERAGPECIESYPQLQSDFELKRRLPRLLGEKRKRSASFRSYAGLTRAFFESIRAVSGKPVIVDSSKVWARAFAHSLVPRMDLYVVHLVRDGRGIVVSHRRSYRADLPVSTIWDYEDNPRWNAAVRRRVLYLLSIARWTVQNLGAEWVCARLGPKRAMRLRYEDFVADPKGALERIGSLIELDLAGVADAATSGKPMEAGHNVGGNSTKKSGTVTLRPDAQEWRTVLSPAEQRLAWRLMGWTLRRYDYKR
jgi:hypothetical protein